MPDLYQTAYAVAVGIVAAYFLLAKRRFDFLAIAFLGVLFYFLPLFVGQVLQSDAHLQSTIQPEIYLFATAYVLALAAAAVLTGARGPNAQGTRPAAKTSAIYLALSVIGLASALVSSKGAVLQFDKTKEMAEIGIAFTLFEIAASLACIAAVVERRWACLGGGLSLLVIDLFAGFRVYAVLTALAVAVILLVREGAVRLIGKLPSYGLAAAAVAATLLLVHSARLEIFTRILRSHDALAASQSTATLRSDTIQFNALSDQSRDARRSDQDAGIARSDQGRGADRSDGGVSAAQSDQVHGAESSQILRLVELPLKVISQSEPFMIQATLVGVVQTGMSCKASNILKSIWLLVPPGMARFGPPNPYPPTFYDEYQPVLYPNIDYGTAGNIWAEMLCRFGYGGLAVFALLQIGVLVGLGRLMSWVSPAASVPVALAGVIIAFYMNRNDLNFTLVMLRQVALVASMTWLIAWSIRLARISLSR